MHRLQLLIFVIGIIWSGLTYAEDEDEDLIRMKKGMVLVEHSSIVTGETQEEYKLVPYVERRPNWGVTFSVGYSSYEPINYEPDFVTANFSDVYKTAEMPLIELFMSVKRNFSMGSLGFEVGVGMYQNSSDNKALSDSLLRVIPIRVGAVYFMDAMSPNPLFVPYLAGGAYTMMYREELTGGSSNNGNTQVAAYFHGGFELRLDWLDEAGSRIAYQESGIEGTYAYFELQKFMASAAKADGDFSNDYSYAGGLRVEF